MPCAGAVQDASRSVQNTACEMDGTHFKTTHTEKFVKQTLQSRTTSSHTHEKNCVCGTCAVQ